MWTVQMTHEVLEQPKHSQPLQAGFLLHFIKAGVTHAGSRRTWGTGQKHDFSPHSALTRTLIQRACNEN